MKDLVPAAMVACFVLLVAAVVAHRRMTVDPTAEEHGTDCCHCAALRHPSQRAVRAALSTIPGPRGGQR